MAVLNAAVPALLEMAELSDGEVVLYALDATEPALVAHRAKGGRAVFLQGGAAVLAQGHSETSGANVEALLKRFDSHGNNVVNDAEIDAATVLAVVATAWALNISPELISAGMDTFVPKLHVVDHPAVHAAAAVSAAATA